MPIIFLLIFLILNACTHPVQELHDPSIAKTEEDFRALVTPVTTPGNTLETGATPVKSQHPQGAGSSSTPISAWPEALLIPLSVHITHAMHMEDVLEVLCEKAGVAYVLDQDIEGHLAYQATNRPFGEILETLCDQLNLRFSFDNDLLKI